ncbi:hypothetical protein WME90_46475 [Sorangium sp. So ce375]|uniref:hypothetical protein n=1 Tax=Sorangium sp. So ce375 TaxID=3133306 RepID=UPI003F5C3AEE
MAGRTADVDEGETGGGKDELKACWGDSSCNELFLSSACPGSAECFASGSGSSYSVACIYG